MNCSFSDTCRSQTCEAGKINYVYLHNCCCCSVSQLCLTLCDPMDCSTPGFPVLHHLPEPAQTHVHWVSDAIQPSHPVIPFSCLQFFPASGPFLMSQFFTSGGQSIGASASGLPMNIQDWFPLGLTGLISLQSKGLSISFPTPQFKSINSLVLSFLYSPTLTSIHDYWKNHSFDEMDLCLQSNVSAFYYAVWVGRNFSSKE